MTRKTTEANGLWPYHLNARTVNREIFPLPMPILWQIFCDYLYFAHAAHNIRIYSFVLMPNHFHLIASFPERNMSAAMNYFMGETSRRISFAAGRCNQVYGRRFHRTLISSERYFRHAYKYVYRNPVKAGLAVRTEDYEFSTLKSLLGKSRALIPVEEDFLLFNPNFRKETVHWLNQAPQQSHDDEIRRALRRKVFGLPKNPISRAPSELELREF